MTGTTDFRLPSRYTFLKLLGKGSYGTASAFRDLDTGMDVAVKRVRKVFDDFMVARRTLREIRLMRQISHPHLLKLYDVVPLSDGAGDLYFVMELMDSDLDKLIHSSRHLINEQQARSFITQVLLGLLYLHSAHILHRDLKPGNVFVLLGQGLAKIGDFGLSRGICLNHLTGDATHPHDEQLTEYVVTRWYRAPEVLLARSQYGPAIDVWSVGCILFEMWTRQALFPGKNSYDQLQRVMDVIGPIPLSECAWVPRQSRALLDRCNQGGSGSQRLSVVAKGVARADGVDLVRQLCAFGPEKRIGVQQAMSHPYLVGMTTEADIATARSAVIADIAYDRVFDGTAKEAEASAMPRLSGMLRREVAQVHAERRQQEERSLGKPSKCHEAEEDGASRPRLEKPEDRSEDEPSARLRRQLAEAVKGGILSEEKASRLRQKVEEATKDDVAARLRRLSKNQAVPPGIANVAAPFRSRRRSAGYSEEHSPTRDGAGLGLGYDRQRSAGISDAAALRPTAADRTPPRARVGSEGISALMRGTTKVAWGVSEDATAAAAPATSQPPGVLQTSVWERSEPSRRWQGQGLSGFTSSALAAAAVDDRAGRGWAPTDDARDARVPGATAKRAGATGVFQGGGIGYMF